MGVPNFLEAWTVEPWVKFNSSQEPVGLKYGLSKNISEHKEIIEYQLHSHTPFRASFLSFEAISELGGEGWWPRYLRFKPVRKRTDKSEDAARCQVNFSPHFSHIAVMRLQSASVDQFGKFTIICCWFSMKNPCLIGTVTFCAFVRNILSSTAAFQLLCACLRLFSWRRCLGSSSQVFESNWLPFISVEMTKWKDMWRNFFTDVDVSGVLGATTLPLLRWLTTLTDRSSVFRPRSAAQFDSKIKRRLNDQGNRL